MSRYLDSNKIAASARKVRARNLRLIKGFSIAIALILAFILGFALRSNVSLIQDLGFNVQTDSEALSANGAGSDTDSYTSLAARVAEVEALLEGESMASFDLDATSQEVLSAYISQGDDSYLRYYTPAEYSQLQQNASHDYTGIGVLFAEYNGQAYAVDIFDNSAAQVAGVKQNDFVVAIDGNSNKTWSVSDVTEAINKEDGDSVVITWRRPDSLEADGGKEYTTTLTCSVYNEKNVSSEVDNGVGYIKIKQFTQDSDNAVQDAIKSCEDGGAQSYVLDLRNNPGGYLTQAVSVADLFMEGGTVVQVETKTGTTAQSANGDVATNKPLVVLVNKNTAGASEVLAAALKESQRATIVGTTTMGKGSVQVIRDLSFGGAIRYTAAYYLTPGGHEINGEGVTPDMVVSSTSGSDNQKNLALRTAQSLA